MIEVLAWLLIASPTTHHGGVPHIIDRFKTQEQCMHVLTGMNGDTNRGYYTKCIQANVYIKKD